MTWTIGQIQNELAQLRDSVQRQKENLDKQLETIQSHIDQLKKPEPCPLEEGKEVEISLTPAQYKEWYESVYWSDCATVTIRVESLNNAYNQYGLRIRWGKSKKAVIEGIAKELVRITGKKVD